MNSMGMDYLLLAKQLCRSMTANSVANIVSFETFSRKEQLLLALCGLALRPG